MYKCVTDVFSIRVSVSIDTQLYTCKISAYKIKYLSGVCLLVRIESALVVN